jgi:hypothetical protein
MIALSLILCFTTFPLSLRFSVPSQKLPMVPEHFQAKRSLGRGKQMRQDKELEIRSDPVESEKARGRFRPLPPLNA